MSEDEFSQKHLRFDWVKTLWSRQNRTHINLIASSSQLQRERHGLHSLVCLQTVRWEQTKHPRPAAVNNQQNTYRRGSEVGGGADKAMGRGSDSLVSYGSSLTQSFVLHLVYM